jgi:hypothetical protein
MYADGINVIDENINNKKKTTEALLDISEKVDLEINAEKTKCMIMSYYQNVG